MNIGDIFFIYIFIFFIFIFMLFVSEYLAGTYHGDFSREQKKQPFKYDECQYKKEYAYIYIDRQYMSSAK